MDLILSRARGLEQHVHEQTEGTSNYRNKMRSFYLNLKAAGNPALREGVVSGEISIKELYLMDPKVSSLWVAFPRHSCPRRLPSAF